MKFKFLSFALVAAAFASCSSDDLTVNGTAQTQLGENEVFAYIAEPEDGASTRAGWAIQYTEAGTIKQQAVFLPGDVFKMYKTNTWKPQLLKFKSEGTVGTINGGVFEWADADSKYNDGTDATDMTNREYAVFPADYFSFADESRTKLKFTLPATIDYGYFTGRASTVKDGYTVYPSIFPLFGFADEDNNVKFNYMTTVIRVALQGLAAGEHYLKLSADSKLSGEFLSSADDFNAADYTSEDLPVFNTTATEVTAEKALKVTFNIPEASAGKDQCIFLPLPTGEYDIANLNLYLDGDEDANKLPMTLTYKVDDEFIALSSIDDDFVAGADCPAKVKGNWNADDDKYNFGRGIQLLATKSAAVAYTVNSLTEINEKLVSLASFGRDVEATLTLGASITSNDAGTDRSKYLIIPALKNNVTLKFTAADAKTIGALTVKDEGSVSSAKTLTFELDEHVTMNGAINYTSKQNLALNASSDQAFANVNIQSTANVEIGTGFNRVGVVVTVPEKGNLTVNTTDATDVVNAITLAKAATSVTIKKGIVTTLTLPDANQTITMTGGKIATLAPATLTAARTITLNTSGAAEIGTITQASSAKKYSYTFNATWNDDTETSNATATAKIYTAAQLKAASGVDDPAVLYADVTISMDKATFSGVGNMAKSLKGTGKSDLSADGTGATAHSIIGLTAPLFGTLSDNAVISYLNLTKVNITGEDINGVGALAKTSTGATIENVTVAGTIGSANKQAYTTSINVGGLLGTVTEGTVAITDCKLNGVTVQGYANLGGYIGSVRGGTVTISATDAALGGILTINKTLDLDVNKDMNCGAVGNFIGSLTGTADKTITIGAAETQTFAKFITTTNLKSAVPTSFGFAKNYKTSGKPYLGMGAYSYAIGYSTPATVSLTLFGATKNADEENFSIDDINVYTE